MTDQREVTWGEAFSQVFQIHPFALLLTMGLVMYFSITLQGKTPFSDKLFVALFLLVFIFMLVFFEALRLADNQRVKEENWRRMVLG